MICRLPLLIAICFFVTVSTPLAAGTFTGTTDQKTYTLEQLPEALQGVRLIFIGERHDSLAHHKMQQDVIRVLLDSGRSVAVGMEMFQAGNQGVLDAWIKGTIETDLFRTSFEHQWGYWPEYRNLLFFARQKSVPLIGLNIPRSIVRKVSRNGFDNLPDQFKQEVGVTECVVTPDYETLLRESLGHHGKEPTAERFQFFCEAQMMWDRSMARNAEEFLKNNPGKTLVVIAGSVHAWRQGIARQLSQPIPHKVILPSAPGFRTLKDLTVEDADFVWRAP